MEEILTKNIRKKNWKMAAEWGTKERSRSGGREPDDMKRPLRVTMTQHFSLSRLLMKLGDLSREVDC